MENELGLSGHAIVGGYGHLGERIVAEFLARGMEVVLVDKEISDIVRKKAKTGGFHIVEGDIRDEEALIQAGVDTARCLVASSHDDCANLEAAISARQRNKDMSVVVRLFDQTLAKRVEGAFKIQALSSSFLAAPAFVKAATNDTLVAIINADDCYISIHEGSAVQSGEGFPEGVFVVKRDLSMRMIQPADGKTPPEGSLFVAMQESGSRAASKFHKKKERSAFADLRSNLHKLHFSHIAREISDTWYSAPWIIRFITLAFTVVGIISVLMFYFVADMGPIDALSITLITMSTGGYEGYSFLTLPAGLKIYALIMTLCGTALLATIYALIADRVLAARMDFMLGRRDIHLKDHMVVIGLGNVGFTVASDLDVLGEDVVAIDDKEDSDAVLAGRAIFLVVVGDAKRTSILKRAGVERAKVVLAVTDDQMMNLSVVLHAHEMNPRIKTIMRTYDMDLAERFKTGLDAVLSTSAIAAPAFVDAALYPGVQGSFRRTGDDVLVAIHHVDRTSPLRYKTVSDITDQMGLSVVLKAETASSRYQFTQPLTKITEGNKLVVLLTRKRVDKLLPKA